MDSSDIENAFGASIEKKDLDFIVNGGASLGFFEDLNEIARLMKKPVPILTGNTQFPTTCLNGELHNLEMVLHHNAIEVNLVYAGKGAAEHNIDESFSIYFYKKHEIVSYFCSSVRRSKPTFRLVSEYSAGNSVLQDIQKGFEKAATGDYLGFAWSQNPRECSLKDPKLTSPNNEVYLAMQSFIKIFSKMIKDEDIYVNSRRKENAVQEIGKNIT